ncbi:DNA primase POLA3 [Wolffia australiana]
MTREDDQNGTSEMDVDDCSPVPRNLLASVKGFHPDYLKVFYGKLFPFGDIFKWMSYGNDGKHPACDQSFFGRREFSFSLSNDVYVRFQSFSNETEMENAIKEKCPFKIDLGAVYSVDPSRRQAYSGNNVFVPVERELVFDIDISDYDDVRYCCSGADVCSDCWPLMTAAIRVIDTALRDDFGFNHILWVFSGRRGVHCWVCDARARRLTDEQRSAVAEYLRVYKANENGLKKVSFVGHALHPFLVRSYEDVLKDFFEKELLPAQSLLEDESRYEKILELIPDDSTKSEIRNRWNSSNRRSTVSKEDVNLGRWEQLKHTLQATKHKGLRRCVEEIVFSYTYPRLDIEVSKRMNHLLKAPFCVHPKTGHVCVPIDPARCDNFVPGKVPKVSELLEELNHVDGGHVTHDWERTSLGGHVSFFRSSFLQPLLKSCKEELEAAYSAKIRHTKDTLGW